AAATQLRDWGAHLGGRIGYCLGRERAHEAVRESEERLRLALEAGHMGTWDWEIRSGRVTWSPNLEALFGMEPGTFGNTLEAFLEAVHADDRQRVRSAITRVLQNNLPLHLEYRVAM